jgi:hypothetical protein
MLRQRSACREMFLPLEKFVLLHLDVMLRVGVICPLLQLQMKVSRLRIL